MSILRVIKIDPESIPNQVEDMVQDDVLSGITSGMSADRTNATHCVNIVLVWFGSAMQKTDNKVLLCEFSKHIKEGEEKFFFI